MSLMDQVKELCEISSLNMTFEEFNESSSLLLHQIYNSKEINEDIILSSVNKIVYCHWFQFKCSINVCFSIIKQSILFIYSNNKSHIDMNRREIKKRKASDLEEEEEIDETHLLVSNKAFMSISNDELIPKIIDLINRRTKEEKENDHSSLWQLLRFTFWLSMESNDWLIQSTLQLSTFFEPLSSLKVPIQPLTLYFKMIIMLRTLPLCTLKSLEFAIKLVEEINAPQISRTLPMYMRFNIWYTGTWIRTLVYFINRVTYKGNSNSSNRSSSNQSISMLLQDIKSGLDSCFKCAVEPIHLSLSYNLQGLVNMIHSETFVEFDNESMISKRNDSAESFRASIKFSYNSSTSNNNTNNNNNNNNKNKNNDSAHQELLITHSSLDMSSYGLIALYNFSLLCLRTGKPKSGITIITQILSNLEAISSIEDLSSESIAQLPNPYTLLYTFAISAATGGYQSSSLSSFEYLFSLLDGTIDSHSTQCPIIYRAFHPYNSNSTTFSGNIINSSPTSYALSSILPPYLQLVCERCVLLLNQKTEASVVLVIELLTASLSKPTICYNANSLIKFKAFKLLGDALLLASRPQSAYQSFITSFSYAFEPLLNHKKSTMEGSQAPPTAEETLSYIGNTSALVSFWKQYNENDSSTFIELGINYSSACLALGLIGSAYRVIRSFILAQDLQKVTLDIRLCRQYCCILLFHAMDEKYKAHRNHGAKLWCSTFGGEQNVVERLRSSLPNEDLHIDRMALQVLGISIPEKDKEKGKENEKEKGKENTVAYFLSELESMDPAMFD